jgi:hypothetical protein
MIELLEDAGQLGHHVLADVAALGTRVVDQLIGLVEGLGVFQYLGSRERWRARSKRMGSSSLPSESATELVIFGPVGLEGPLFQGIRSPSTGPGAST